MPYCMYNNVIIIMRSLYLLIIKHGHLGRGETITEGRIAPLEKVLYLSHDKDEYT